MKTNTARTNVMTKLFAVILTACMLGNIAATVNAVGTPQQDHAMTELSAGVPLVDTASLPSKDHPLETILVPASAVTKDAATAVPTQRYQDGNGWVDWTYADDGYITVDYTAKTSKRIKCTVVGPEMKYVYDLIPGEETTLSLSEGTGDYKVSLLENISGTSYRVKTSVQFNATVDSELAPFLVSNPYTDWADAPETVAMAERLTRDAGTNLEKVEAIYDWVVENLSYDYEKAATVAAGYLPDLDDTLETRTGICFDYASITTGMLRSQDIPCKLVIGYAGEAYHAWISVYSDGDGWLENQIHFSSGTWERMDPTFASTGNSRPWVMRYIGDGSNYAAERWY